MTWLHKIGTTQNWLDFFNQPQSNVAKGGNLWEFNISFLKNSTNESDACKTSNYPITSMMYLLFEGLFMSYFSLHNL
jgi:hypothetical protein